MATEPAATPPTPPAENARSLVGRHVRVRFEDGRWYWGTFLLYSGRIGALHVAYDDGDRRWHALRALDSVKGGILGGHDAGVGANAVADVPFEFVSEDEMTARLEEAWDAEQKRVAEIRKRLEERRKAREEVKRHANRVKVAGSGAVGMVAAANVKNSSENVAPKKKFRVLEGVLDAELIDSTFRAISTDFEPQTISTSVYPKWVISRYMEVSASEQRHKTQQGGAEADPVLLEKCLPLLTACDAIFKRCYIELKGARRTGHTAAAGTGEGSDAKRTGSGGGLVAAEEDSDGGYKFSRLQSFVTRYRPLPGEASLPKHVDGISIDGSIVVGMPTDKPFDGGGLTVWEGSPDDPIATHYFPMRPGDVCFLDKLVWHQADPITSGERWAIVIFYRAKRR